MKDNDSQLLSVAALYKRKILEPARLYAEGSGKLVLAGFSAPTVVSVGIDALRSADFSLDEEDRGGSIFYTKFAEISRIDQKTAEGVLIRWITTASCTMTILKDKDQDWADWDGFGSCTIGFTYHTGRYATQDRAKGVDMHLTSGSTSPYLAVHLGRLVEPVSARASYEVIRNKSLSSIQFHEAKGFMIKMKKDRYIAA
ncbi:hypothetical protein VW23_001630 [Devosia insulae DS-56]|uniref:Uncharacterized protein n=1 Tax=Devosia insulae DS-56 TaxID=1116389 RepID=A0A1E5XMR2_9HYPH|nr:hypothetical protein [Devosia insulae]OEO29774.1 hypothetical protein VW23_001630 [Devosia insulae DS-56]